MKATLCEITRYLAQIGVNYTGNRGANPQGGCYEVNYTGKRGANYAGKSLKWGVLGGGIGGGGGGEGGYMG